jgi:hypothetical protein
MPSSPQRRGTATSFDLFPTIHWDPREGRQVAHSKRVPKSDLASWENALQASGLAYSVDPEGTSPDAMLHWSAPVVTVVDNWSVRFNEVQQSLWLNDEVAEQMAKLTDPAGKANFKADIEAILRGERTWTDDTGTIHPLDLATIFATVSAFGIETAIFDDLVKDLAAGVEAELISVPVLQLSRIFPAFARGIVPNQPLLPDAILYGPTTVVPPPTTRPLAPLFTNADRIYSTVTLLTEEPTIPAELQVEMAALTIDAQLRAGTTAAGYWLKKAPEGDQLADGRWHYRLEYWFAERLGLFAQRKIVS